MSTDRVEVHLGLNGSHHGDGSRGYPVRTLQQAMRLVRLRRQPGQQAVVWVHPGVHPMRETLELGPDDSFTTFAATGDGGVFDGSVAVEGWAERGLKGRTVWAAPLPDRPFTTLYVAEERRPRPRYPRQGLLRMAGQPGLDVHGDFDGTLFDGSDRFLVRDGDLPELADPGSVEVVVPHFWVQERMPIARIDRAARTVVSSRRSIFALRDDAIEDYAQYYLDNVGEAFGEAEGEWYADRKGAVVGDGVPRLLYAPREGERIGETEVRVPAVAQFLRADGAAEDCRPIRAVRFEGIGFRYAGFEETPPARAPFGVREDDLLPRDVVFAASVQAATEVPAALSFTGARDCVLLGGAVEHVDGYGVEFAAGSRGNLVSGVTLRDLGAGAVRAGGAPDELSPLFSRANEVSDCEISEGGRVYPNAVAVLFQHGSHNVIAHNHISDLYYSAISVGWVWDYARSPSHTNLIAGNHIHDIGQGRLNDCGAVYLLGIAPGTAVRGNYIHDVRCRNYGGWGIYLDQGSSHVVVEENVCVGMSHQAFHVNFGRENTVRHNIFALGGESQVAVTHPQADIAFTFSHNIVVGRGTPGFAGRKDHRDLRNLVIESDLNLFWDYAPLDGAVRAGNGGYRDGRVWTIDEPADALWEARGYDIHSVTADPLFADLEGRDFRVAPDSPAYGLGIRVPDPSTAGPRPPEARRHPLGRPTLPDPWPSPGG